ncbi:MAG: hypothetical protein AAFN08_00450 [Cyanobacteria bacterium J06559_3]
MKSRRVWTSVAASTTKCAAHYHVADPGTNSFISCFKGEIGCKFDDDSADQLCDATAASDRPGRPEDGGPGGTEDGPRPGGPRGEAAVPPGFAEAATKLGATVDELMAALGEPPFDLAAAATLGVTTMELTEALPPPPQQQPGPLLQE